MFQYEKNPDEITKNKTILNSKVILTCNKQRYETISIQSKLTNTQNNIN